MNIRDRKRWNNILIFICCAFIIAFGILNHQPQEKKIHEISGEESIRSIRFVSAEFDYTFRLKASLWWLQQPFRYPAIASRISQIQQILDADIYKHINNNNAAEFGISDNNYLQLNEQRIYFGDQALDSAHRYVQINERILLIDDIYYTLLNNGPAYWLGKQVLPENEELLLSISINDSLYTEAELINLASAWYEAEADNLIFPADQFIQPAADDTAITITFTDDSTYQYIFLKERFFLNTNYNLVYELSAENAQKLLKP